MALRCPREFYYRYVDKVAPPETMPEMRIGKARHTALEHAIQGTPPEQALADAKEALTDEEKQRADTIGVGVPPFLERLQQFENNHRVGKRLVEYTLAVREDFTSTQFYSNDAFYRGILDFGYIYDDTNVAILDHKTGERYNWHTISDQLEGYAALAAASFRGVRRYWLGVHWVAHSDVEWRKPVSHGHITQSFFQRVMDNIEAAALAVDDGPRPNPAAWCGRCSYRSICPTAREARYERVDDEFDID